MSDNDIPFNPLPPPSPRKLAYTYMEARELLSISKNIWTALIKSGEIRPIDGHNVVSFAELERYVRIHTKERGRKKKGGHRK